MPASIYRRAALFSGFLMFVSLTVLPVAATSVSAATYAVEYFIDIDPGEGQGTAIPIPEVWTGSQGVTAGIATASLSPGLHTLYVRAKDSTDRWGVPRASVFNVMVAPPPPNIASLEYFIVPDGSSLNSQKDGEFLQQGLSQPTISYSTTLSTVQLATGWYTLYVRGRDTLGRWETDQNLQKKRFFVGWQLATTTEIGLGAGGAIESIVPEGNQYDAKLYDDGATVNLTAVPATGSTIMAWPERNPAIPQDCDVISGDKRVCTVTMNGHRAVRVTIRDITPPETTITNRPPDPDHLSRPTFTYSANEPVSKYLCTVDSNPEYDCTSVFMLPTALASGRHTFSVRAKDIAGNIGPLPESYIWTYIPRYLLSAAMNGIGAGTVNSTSSLGIACPGDCSEILNEGTDGTLYATPDFNSYFSGWSGGECSSLGPCEVTMLADTVITASFYQYPPVKLAGAASYFPLLTGALDQAVAGSSVVLELRGTVIKDQPVVSKGIDVTLRGGYDGTYSLRSGETVIEGILTVGAGTLMVDAVTIK